jgi:hypothetical protein
MKYALAAVAAIMVATPALADKPATPVTVESSPGVDGSGHVIAINVPQVLFGGVAPPHGFIVCYEDTPRMFVLDTTSASPSADEMETSGFQLAVPVSSPYPHCITTPPGYKPIGPVWVMNIGEVGNFVARMW